MRHAGWYSILGMEAFHRLLLDLGHQVDVGAMNEVEAGALVARHIQAELKCSRVTIWLVVGEAGHRAMQRIVTYDAPSDRAITSPLELEEGTSDYFDTLVGQRFYVSNDTFADANFATVVESFLMPHNARALMAAYIGVNGDAWGVITCIDDAPRTWLPAEMGLLKRCAAEVSVRRARRRAREGPSSLIGRRTRKPALPR